LVIKNNVLILTHRNNEIKIKVMSLQLNQIRNDYKKAPQFSTDATHEAMIVKIFYTKRKFTIGVNYWTKEEIKLGSRIMDGMKCEIIEPLYLA
jgi:hypothetical protein